MNSKNDSNHEYRRRPERGSRPMLVIGVILLNISLFLAAFALSFNMIVNPIEQRDEQVRDLTEENAKLRSDAQLLQDQLDVVQSELDSYKKKSGSSRSYNYNDYLNDEDDYTAVDDEDRNDGDDEDRSESSSGTRSSNDDEMNMDEN